MVIVRDDIAHARKSEYEHEILNVQCMVIEFLIRKEKWYFITYYKSPRVKNPDFIDCVKKMYDEVIPVAKETILVGDININMLVDNCFTNDICDVYNVTNVIDKPTCHKVERGTLLDPIIVSNRHRIATYFNVVCGYSDFHNLVGCVTKLNVEKQHPKKITYRSYKKFDPEQFKYDVSTIPFYICDVFDDANDQYWMFSKLFTDVLDEHAPMKQRYITKYQVPYMNSLLRKEMYRRNMLKNRYFKNRSDP